MTVTAVPRTTRLIGRAWTVLAGVALVAALAVGAGCTALEMADKESDKLLDKLNEPSGSSSSSSYSSGKAKVSGLSVVERDAMPKRTVKDNRGNDVVIWGQAKSSSTTPGHAKAMEAKALAMARSWRTATGRVGSQDSRYHWRAPRRQGGRDRGQVEIRQRKKAG